MSWKSRIKYLVCAGVIIAAILMWHQEDLVTSFSDTKRSLSSSAPTPQRHSFPTSQDKDNAAETSTIDRDVDPQFKAWFQQEAQLIDKPNADGRSREVILKEKARKFSHLQKAYLQARALDSQMPATERILSSYLLSLTSGSQEALIDLASREINSEGMAPHTITETQIMQERSLGIMAVDGVVNGSEDVSNRLQALQKIISQSNDSVIKNYAQRKFEELQTQL